MNELRDVKITFHKETARIREELNEHLESINQNTNEIEHCYEYLAEIDAKIEKLNERLDEMQIQSQGLTSKIQLTLREQEVFMVLYTIDEPISSDETARRLGLTEEMVQRYLQSITRKGVPILRSFADGITVYSLDLKFKDLQARKNILNIEEAVAQQLLSEKAI